MKYLFLTENDSDDIESLVLCMENPQEILDLIKNNKELIEKYQLNGLILELPSSVYFLSEEASSQVIAEEIETSEELECETYHSQTIRIYLHYCIIECYDGDVYQRVHLSQGQLADVTNAKNTKEKDFYFFG